MMKGYSTRDMAKASKGKPLVCIRECVAPGVASWKEGEKITDPEMIKMLQGNPNFIELKEDK